MGWGGEETEFVRVVLCAYCMYIFLILATKKMVSGYQSVENTSSVNGEPIVYIALCCSTEHTTPELHH